MVYKANPGAGRVEAGEARRPFWRWGCRLGGKVGMEREEEPQVRVGRLFKRGGGNWLPVWDSTV